MGKGKSGSPFQWQTSLFSLEESGPYSTKILFNFLHVAITDLMFRLKQSREQTICPGPQQPGGINCPSS